MRRVLGLFLICGLFSGTPALAGPLHDAAMAGNLAAVKRLLNAGVAVDQPGFIGRTSLIMAATEGQVDVVELLIDRGADINLLDAADGSALHYATLEGHGEVVSLLIAHGAKVNKKFADDMTPLDNAVRLQLAEIEGSLRQAGAHCGTNPRYSCKENKKKKSTLSAKAP